MAKNKKPQLAVPVEEFINSADYDGPKKWLNQPFTERLARIKDELSRKMMGLKIPSSQLWGDEFEQPEIVSGVLSFKGRPGGVIKRGNFWVLKLLACWDTLGLLENSLKSGDSNNALHLALIFGQRYSEYLYLSEFEEPIIQENDRSEILESTRDRNLKRSQERRKAARSELERRLKENPGRLKTALLTAMANEGAWGSLRQLKTYCKGLG